MGKYCGCLKEGISKAVMTFVGFEFYLFPQESCNGSNLKVNFNAFEIPKHERVDF